MAQVPIRVAHQTGIVHQPRPAIMVTMQQPPPNTVTGLVSVSPMMASSVVVAHAPPPLSHHHPHHHPNHQQHHRHHQQPATSFHHQQLSTAQHVAAGAAVVQLSRPPVPAAGAPVELLHQPTAAAASVDVSGPHGASTTSVVSSSSAAVDGKEKTSMCLINELARFNKVQHQYRLTDEDGPAHKKRFTVILQLGEESYTATGCSIKKAQHAAAGVALRDTQLRHPPPKPQRAPRTSLTPTVELNALAMRRGESVIYTLMDSTFLPTNQISYRFGYPRFQLHGAPRPQCQVSVLVGGREYFGLAGNPQAARHAAAAHALNELRDLPLPAHLQDAQLDAVTTDDPNAELKSPISLVHEQALRRAMSVSFGVTEETGPAHMRVFVTRCHVGELATDGEGSSKKLSKKRSAENMLDELRKLPLLPTSQSLTKTKRKPSTTKKKSRNLIKVTSEEHKSPPDPHQGVNPISRLIQIQQARREREPVYTLLEERGVARRREFVMSVAVGEHTCQGCGPNKKLAKRAAADSLLVAMGYVKPPPPAGKPAIRQQPPSADPPTATAGGSTEHRGRRHVRFQMTKESDVEKGTTSSLTTPAVTTGAVPTSSSTSPPASSSQGRQLAPGLILVPGSSSPTASVSVAYPGSASRAACGETSLTSGSSCEKSEGSARTAAHFNPAHKKTVLVDVSSPAPAVASAANTVCSNSSPIVTGIRAKDQLLYLAKVMQFQVQFTDVPRSNRGEFLSLVSLSTRPPHMCHGSGTTVETAQDQAALTALAQITQMGLDSCGAAGGVGDGALHSTTNGV